MQVRERRNQSGSLAGQGVRQELPGTDNLVVKASKHKITLGDSDSLCHSLLSLVIDSLERVKYLAYLCPSNLTIERSLSTPYSIPSRFYQDRLEHTAI